MADTLNIFGNTYTGVTGIIATDNNDTEKTYIRPQGTKSITQNGTGINVTEYATVDVDVSSGMDIPTFTLIWNEDEDDAVITCDKTHADIASLLNNGSRTAIAYSPDWGEYATATFVEISEDRAFVYVVYNGVMPDYDIHYHTDGTISMVFPSEYSESLSVTSNGTYYPTKVITEVNVNVPSSSPSLQTKTKTYTPTESQQTETVSADSGYDGLDQVNVTVNAISSSYVGSGITRRSSTDLTASGATVTVPSGYYSEQTSKSVASGTAGTPTATKGTVSNHSISVTPSVTNTTGYISGGTKTGTAITVTAAELDSGTKTIDENGTDIDVVGYASVDVDIPTGTARTSSDLTVSGAIVTVPAGLYSEQATKSVASGIAGTPSATKGTVSNHSITITPSVTNSTGYITGGTKTGTAVTVTASELVSDTKTINITSNGTTTEDVTNYESAEITVSVPGPTLQSKTASPTESQQTITPDTGYDGLSSVIVDAVDDEYVGTAITRRSSTDLTSSGATITVPSGYYSEQASKAVASGSTGTPTATKGTVSNHSVSVTPSVTNTTGYITGGTKTGTAVTVTASELDSGTKTISENGTGINVVGYASVDVSVPSEAPTLQTKSATYTPTESQQTDTITADNGYDGLDEVNVTVNAISSTYVGTDITRRSSSDLTASGATVTVPSGYYSAQASKSVASGSATTPATTITANPSISVSASGLITATTSTSQNVTPTVSAGYVSSGTAGKITVSGSKTEQLTTKAATTYNASATDQTIASGQYLTGTQTIRGVTYSGLSAGNIASGVTVKIGDSADDDRIASVTGTLSFVTYYTGSTDPSSSVGSNGDIYLKTS